MTFTLDKVSVVSYDARNKPFKRRRSPQEATMLTALKLTAALQLTTKLLTDGKVRVTQAGNRPSVRRDHAGNVLSVNIPVIPSEPSKDFLAALHGFLDQEVAGVLFTDPKQLRERKEVALAELSALSPALIPRFETLLGLIERVRVERMMTIQFEGSVRNLNSALDFLLNGEVKARLADMLASEEKDGLIAEVLPLWLRAAAGSAYMSLFLKENGLEAFALMLTSTFPTIEERMHDLPSSGSSVTLALDIIKAWHEQTKKDEPGEGEEAENKPADGDDDDVEGLTPDKGDDGSHDAENDPYDDDASDGEGEGGEDDAESDDSGEDGDEGEGEGSGSEESDGDGGDTDDEDGDDAKEGGDDDGKGGPGSGAIKQRALTEALMALSKNERNVMYDLKNDKLSYEKIAEKRGLSVEEVKKTVLTARKTLNQTYRERKAA